MWLFAEVARSSTMQWSFSNNKLAHPQYHSFKGQDQNNNNKPKIGFESLASAGLVTITTTTEVVDTIHRPYSTRKIGAQYSSSQTHHVPTRNGVVGTTELRGAPKTSPGPAQLTMFYAGSVCVYDNISPEKAQAIMLLAGNAPPHVTTPSPSTTSTASPVHTIPNVNKFHGTSPSNFSSSPIPITSRGISQSVGVLFNNTSETTIIKSIGVLKSPSNSTTEPSKIVTSQESRHLSAVPQARKASLARFLEKRKERVVSASPYGNSKQTSQHMTTTPGSSGNWTFSINSSGSMSPLLPATH